MTKKPSKESQSRPSTRSRKLSRLQGTTVLKQKSKPSSTKRTPKAKSPKKIRIRESTYLADEPEFKYMQKMPLIDSAKLYYVKLRDKISSWWNT